ncbi:hypothetical protein SAMN05421636_103112 [Pricia antarctica]|uniref:Uncharacterized protein n=1 Tax=Pricia antarctica TaxID=641691 RepID=A0A1G6ZXS3_9FLAO|nr:hypothetical protein [Pricia antarctica]SDE06436.1 hypothetical protein SAMN05421636_103112 [Pricia antarctica]
MRKLSVVLVAAMLLAAGNVFANEVTSVEPSESISAQISKLLSHNAFIQNEKALTAQVRFTLNNVHQIVVLSVETENLALADFIKQKLNYEKVDLEAYREGKIFTIPVRIVD